MINGMKSNMITKQKTLSSVSYPVKYKKIDKMFVKL